MKKEFIEQVESIALHAWEADQASKPATLAGKVKAHLLAEKVVEMLNGYSMQRRPEQILKSVFLDADRYLVGVCAKFDGIKELTGIEGIDYLSFENHSQWLGNPEEKRRLIIYGYHQDAGSWKIRYAFDGLDIKKEESLNGKVLPTNHLEEADVELITQVLGGIHDKVASALTRKAFLG